MVVVDGGYGGCWWLVCFIGVVERVDNRATSESYLSLIEKDMIFQISKKISLSHWLFFRASGAFLT